MHNYVLRHQAADDAGRPIEFQAKNASKALSIAKQQPHSGPLELWQDGERLCVLSEQRFETGEIWTIRQSVSEDRS
ncbi:hypothetical protein [Altericroceibacterium endophyticum]|uniref:Uncharacterized protein n=1 Tax=Altericroceibacterium endophyticum TaxID=1808508 RepID=A0A6I4T3M6_9SPHN|nr:hypothetical protein [Altericroceibacterium endophyticum]MXO64673.1 hypothetical protein [Altericroceibacterium endophyticum]